MVCCVPYYCCWLVDLRRINDRIVGSNAPDRKALEKAGSLGGKNREGGGSEVGLFTDCIVPTPTNFHHLILFSIFWICVIMC